MIAMKKHILPLIIFAATVAGWLIFYPQMDERIPIHFGPDGQADRYAPRLEAMISMLATMAAIYLLLLFLPKIDPRRRNYRYFSRSYYWIQTAVLFFFAAINFMAIVGGMGYDVPVAHLTQILLGFLFIILGNFTQSVKPNFFLGIRTPWTLSNETVWRKTHRVGAKVMIAAGLAFFLSAFLPAAWPFFVTIALIVILTVFPFAYSYWLYRKLDKSDQ